MTRGYLPSCSALGQADTLELLGGCLSTFPATSHAFLFLKVVVISCSAWKERKSFAATSEGDPQTPRILKAAAELGQILAWAES